MSYARQILQSLKDTFRAYTQTLHPYNQSVMDLAADALVQAQGSFQLFGYSIHCDPITSHDQAEQHIMEIARKHALMSSHSGGLLSPLGVAWHICNAMNLTSAEPEPYAGKH